jgi:hypothetical protein
MSNARNFTIVAIAVAAVRAAQAARAGHGRHRAGTLERCGMRDRASREQHVVGHRRADD